MERSKRPVPLSGTEHVFSCLSVPQSLTTIPPSENHGYRHEFPQWNVPQAGTKVPVAERLLAEGPIDGSFYY
jgi:hypothetical protein